MDNNNANIKFHHALKVDDELCMGCTHCMSACPTNAIRIKQGKAHIMEERCIDCGLCYKSCPVSAILVEQDDFNDIFRFPVRVALIPAVLFGQFESRIPVAAIYEAIRKIGFTHVFEVENMVQAIKEGYERYQDTGTVPRPLISPYCPAVVRLIQVKFPSLTKNIIRVKPPTDMAATWLRKEFTRKGIDPESAGLFYVTPCASKIASVKSPVGGKESEINGVINMDYLYNKIQKELRDIDPEKEWKEKTPQPDTGDILWSLTRGESANRKGRSLAIDGIRNVSDFLNKLEETDNPDIDFLELRACDESCAGGILICSNRFLTVERLNERAKIKAKKKNRIGQLKLRYDDTNYRLDDIKPRSMVKLDDDISEAIKKMDKVEQLLGILPGIDCGACGAPSCRVLAEDSVQGKGDINSCIFKQEWEIINGRISAEEADMINRKIWGDKRNRRSIK